MQSLNIVVIAAVDLPEGGGESTRLKTLCQALIKAGHSVRILVENTSGNVDEKLLQSQGQVNGIPFEYILGNTSPLSGLKFFTAKLKAIKLFKSRLNELHKHKPIDVVWFNMLAAHTILPLTKWAKKRNAKIVHSYEDERIKGRGLKRKLIYWNQLVADKWLTRSANAIVVISHYLKEKYTKLTKAKMPVEIIPTVVDIEKWRVPAKIKSDSDPINLLYYGSFYGFDEVEKMIDSIGILKSKNIAVNLILAGYNRKRPQYMSSLKEYIISKGLNDSVDLKGFTSHDRLINNIENADILIGLRKDDPWSSTGLSTKLSEYLSTGKPVIATGIGENNYYLKNNDNAILVKPGASTQAVADAILLLISNPDLRRKIGNEGHQVALNNFDISVVANRLNKLLSEI